MTVIAMKKTREQTIAELIANCDGAPNCSESDVARFFNTFDERVSRYNVTRFVDNNVAVANNIDLDECEYSTAIDVRKAAERVFVCRLGMLRAVNATTDFDRNDLFDFLSTEFDEDDYVSFDDVLEFYSFSDTFEELYDNEINVLDELRSEFENAVEEQDYNVARELLEQLKKRQY